MIGRMLLTSVFAATALTLAAAPGQAQSSSPISRSQPDCQTILRCNFKRGGVYRGCISAYTCRRCRLVRARNCTVGAQGRRVCRRLVCSWG